MFFGEDDVSKASNGMGVLLVELYWAYADLFQGRPT